MGWWRLDGDASGVLPGNNGVIVGNPVFTNGLVGQALYFDGADDGVKIKPHLN